VNYSAGGKYCRRCECYFITERIFCECCGMQLRRSPGGREYRETSRIVNVNVSPDSRMDSSVAIHLLRDTYATVLDLQTPG
jgi:hypothetical protein